jgi:hypothetical protein
MMSPDSVNALQLLCRHPALLVIAGIAVVGALLPRVCYGSDGSLDVFLGDELGRTPYLFLCPILIGPNTAIGRPLLPSSWRGQPDEKRPPDAPFDCLSDTLSNQ